MKVLILANAGSSHTQKWVTSLANEGVDVHLFSLGYDDARFEEEYGAIPRTFAQVSKGPVPIGAAVFFRFRAAVRLLKKVIRMHKPDIVHAHYATSYGLLGSLSGYQPFIVSVWGSDVFDFPKRSPLHRFLIRFILRKADHVLSTSEIMAKETSLYTDHDILVTPFGVDIDHFQPGKGLSIYQEDVLVIGTIKTLEVLYGIDYLIDAFSLVRKKNPDHQLKLMIVGSGSQEERLKEKVTELSLDEDVRFVGKVPHTAVVDYCNTLDIYVAVSVQESFGVAVLEASACGKPVIVSDVGGLPEVVDHGNTGLIVPSMDVDAIAGAIEQLMDKNRRNEMGKNGRLRVEQLYDWKNCVRQMRRIYESVLT